MNRRRSDKKRCPRCGELKELSEFYSDKHQSNGYKSECKKCHYIRTKNYSKNHLAQSLENRRKYRQTLHGRFNKWKSGAQHRNIPFNLTLEDVRKMPLVCYYSGDTLSLKPNEWNTVSLDRLDSSKGYTKTNVVLCSSNINFMKLKMTYDEFINTCRKIINHVDNTHKSLQ